MVVRRSNPLMAQMSATVTEVGRRAGCSIATVSRVLNNSGPVSLKTRETVLKAIRETQYLSTRAAKQAGGTMRRMSGGVVEIIQHRHSPMEPVSMAGGALRIGPPTSPDAVQPLSERSALTNAFHRHIVDGAIEELSHWGYRAQLRMNTNLVAPDLLADLNGPDRNGVMLIGEYSPDIASFVSQCLHPLVLVDIIHHGPADVITTDNFVGIGLAVDYLLSLKHRDIGFVGMQSDVRGFAERHSAFKLKMIEAGLPVHPEWQYEGEDHIETTADSVRRILSLSSRPTALLCANDCYALGVVRAASGLGIRIPKDLSVVGFDDVDFAAMVTPPLTTVRVPVQEMGRQAVRQLMISMQRGTTTRQLGCHVRLMPELVIRQSATAPTPGVRS